MPEQTKGESLIRELLRYPAKFDKSGRGYQLLQAYFRGMPVASLRPLLTHDNPHVRRTAFFVASELGSAGAEIVEEASAFTLDADRHIAYYALDVVIVCAVGSNAHLFLKLAQAMECDDDVLRYRAMTLTSRSTREQQEAAILACSDDSETCRIHRAGLDALGRATTLSSDEILGFLQHDRALARSYGALLLKLNETVYPELMRRMQTGDDADVAAYLAEEF